MRAAHLLNQILLLLGLRPDGVRALRALALDAGVNHVRLLAAYPVLVLLVDTALSPARADALADRMAALSGLPIQVRPLATFDPALRAEAWRLAMPLEG